MTPLCLLIHVVLEKEHIESTYWKAENILKAKLKQNISFIYLQ